MGNSFTEGFGGGCGLILGVCLALILIPVVSIVGCGLLSGGCVILGSAAREQAREAARKTEEKQQAREASQQPTAPIKSPETSESKIPDKTTLNDDQPKDKQPNHPTEETPPSPVRPKETPPMLDPPLSKEPPPIVNVNLRTWTEAGTGRTIEAEFISMAMGQVKLKKTNGKIVTIPIDNLSEEDQKWIRERGR
jgi:hypothetical protein